MPKAIMETFNLDITRPTKVLLTETGPIVPYTRISIKHSYLTTCEVEVSTALPLTTLLTPFYRQAGNRTPPTKTIGLIPSCNAYITLYIVWRIRTYLLLYTI